MQFLADVFLVFGKFDSLFQPAGIQIPVKKCFVDTYREKIKEDFFKLGRVDGAAISRESDEETGCDAFFGHFAGCACKNFLTAVADRDQTAFSGAFCPEIKAGDGGLKLPREKIREGRPLKIFL